jgi:hypothetical protein
MICIDGVVEGFNRCSLACDDLNRVWHAPDPSRHPVVHHAKALMLQAGRRIEAYLDLHGHSCQHGTFAFACPNDGDCSLAHSEKLFPKLLSVLCEAFAWQKCQFSIPGERKTAGRIVVRQEIGVVQAFTLETSFGGNAGILYDERAWRGIGGKVAEAFYHLLADGVSPLRAVAQADVAREIECQQLVKQAPQNAAKTEKNVKRQIIVRKVGGSHLEKLKVAT